MRENRYVDNLEIMLTNSECYVDILAIIINISEYSLLLLLLSSEDSRSQIQDPDQCTYQGLGSGSDFSAITDEHSKVISLEAFRL